MWKNRPKNCSGQDIASLLIGLVLGALGHKCGVNQLLPLVTVLFATSSSRDNVESLATITLLLSLWAIGLTAWMAIILRLYRALLKTSSSSLPTTTSTTSTTTAHQALIEDRKALVVSAQLRFGVGWVIGACLGLVIAHSIMNTLEEASFSRALAFLGICSLLLVSTRSADQLTDACLDFGCLVGWMTQMALLPTNQAALLVVGESRMTLLLEYSVLILLALLKGLRILIQARRMMTTSPASPAAQYFFESSSEQYLVAGGMAGLLLAQILDSYILHYVLCAFLVADGLQILAWLLLLCPDTTTSSITVVIVKKEGGGSQGLLYDVVDV